MGASRLRVKQSTTTTTTTTTTTNTTTTTTVFNKIPQWKDVRPVQSRWLTYILQMYCTGLCSCQADTKLLEDLNVPRRPQYEKRNLPLQSQYAAHGLT